MYIGLTRTFFAFFCFFSFLAYAQGIIEPGAKLEEGVDEQVANIVVDNLRGEGFVCDSVSSISTKKSPVRFIVECNNRSIGYVITHQGNNYWIIDFL